jgi:hypothetical protein
LKRSKVELYGVESKSSISLSGVVLQSDPPGLCSCAICSLPHISAELNGQIVSFMTNVRLG